eukprot:gene2230-2901_t
MNILNGHIWILQEWLLEKRNLLREGRVLRLESGC